MRAFAAADKSLRFGAACAQSTDTARRGTLAIQDLIQIKPSRFLNLQSGAAPAESWGEGRQSAVPMQRKYRE
jgi:hypothetical protein